MCTHSRVPVFNSLGYIPRSRIAGSYDDSLFNFLRNSQTVFHRSRTTLHSYQVYKSSNFSTFSLTLAFLFQIIIIMAILVDVKWYLIVGFLGFVFFFFWLCSVFIAAHGLSLVAENRGYSSLCAGFSLRWLLLLRAQALDTWVSVVVERGLSSCGSRGLERRLSCCGARA